MIVKCTVCGVEMERVEAEINHWLIRPKTVGEDELFCVCPLHYRRNPMMTVTSATADTMDDAYYRLQREHKQRGEE